MAKRPSGLGRGLGSLIPDAPATAPKPAAETPASKPVAASVAAVATVAPENTVNHITITQIEVNPDQPRAVFRHHELEDLTNSIKEHGILQPLTVHDKGDGSFTLIAGERRLRAAKLAGLERVPALVRQVAAQERLVLALIENIQREDLNPVEEAAAYQRLSEEFSFTQEEIAKKVGKARSTVANTLRLLDLPNEIRQAIADGVVAAGTARAILSLKDDESRLAFFRKMLDKGGMTTRQAEGTTRGKSGKRQRKDPAISAAEDRIRGQLGTRVEVKKKGSKGSIVIGFYSEEEFEKLVSRLEQCG
jgi:ParB family chromosome partitioning protein